MLEFLINDLENSNDFGTKKAAKNICKTTNKKEILMKKLINLNLFTPNVQKIISSLFSSYFVNTKKRAKNNANGKILDICYKKGSFIMAFDHKACDENERNVIKVETNFGKLKIIQMINCTKLKILISHTMKVRRFLEIFPLL